MQIKYVVLAALVLMSLLVGCCSDDCVWYAECVNLFDTSEQYTASGEGCYCHCKFGWSMTACRSYCE